MSLFFFKCFVFCSCFMWRSALSTRQCVDSIMKLDQKSKVKATRAAARAAARVGVGACARTIIPAFQTEISYFYCTSLGVFASMMAAQPSPASVASSAAASGAVSDAESSAASA